MPKPMWRALLTCVALLVVYFFIPVHRDDDNLVIRGLVTAVGIGIAAWLVSIQIRRQVRDPLTPLAGLIVAIIGGVLFFALVDYSVAVSTPGQFAELETRVDALYFALTTIATVGYGDVHAVGQLARTILCLQLTFNLVVIGTAASVLASQLRRRVSRHDD